MDIFLERLFDGVTNGTVYAIMALALVVVFRGTGTINFAQGEMALFTTYIAWALTTQDVPIWAAALVACAVGFLLGAITERTLIRPVRRRNDMATLIVALGLFTGFNALAGLLFDADTKTLPGLFPGGQDDYLSVGGARLYFDALGVWLVVAVLIGLVFALFNRTRLGLHMRAVADNPESAALSGVPTGRILMLGWGLAGVIGSLAGILIAPLSSQQLSLTTMFPILIYASAAALFGGLDSPVGAVVGGLAIGLLESMLTGYVDVIGGTLQQTAALVVIVLILLFRPTGLFGTRQMERL
ncbi:branched-chain amino acid transport system permease protein [Actinocorallia herbida]|uniref:Branched-chain amino acid transport system permease protein n=1 Tax=Actinocorallia herbida TaxID=58109 RepID=A0A3N1CYU5_9ACTN|nr:branched-chain amino acid ABC transporter permease [Actinocorallia herbida]ROO86463.1 branched-chain amino acid transport system permease protein [Actinocorallia herbida]